MRDHRLWAEPREFSKAEAWIDLLMEARWQKEPTTVNFGLTQIECGYGQTLHSLETWASRWRWSKARVKRFLDAAKCANEIRIENVQKTTRITICNYDEYQNPRNASETHAKRTRNALGTQNLAEQGFEGALRNKEKKEHIYSSLRELSAFPAENACNAVGDNGTFLLTRKKRKLTGKRLEWFERFWADFGYKKGKAEAADSWLDIQNLNEELVDKICSGAKKEASARYELMSEGKTPKMAQGWLTARRWEDEQFGCKPINMWGKE